MRPPPPWPTWGQCDCPGVRWHCTGRSPSLALVRDSDHPERLLASHSLKASAQSSSGKSFEEGSNFHPLMPPLFLSFLSAWLFKKIKHGQFHLGRISIPGRAAGRGWNAKAGTTGLAGKRCCTRWAQGVARGAGIRSGTGGVGNGAAQGRDCLSRTWDSPGPTQQSTPSIPSLIWPSLAEGGCPCCVPGTDLGAGKQRAGACLPCHCVPLAQGHCPAHSRHSPKTGYTAV